MGGVEVDGTTADNGNGRTTASAYLEELQRIGIVITVKAHLRKYFVNRRLMELLWGLEV